MKRTNQERDAQLEEAKRLLDMGLKRADVAATLQRDYGLSRATAYRDCESADIQRFAEDAGIDADSVPGISYEDRDALMRMTRQLLITAFKDGNVQDYARLVREYERLARMGGLKQLSQTA